MTIDRHRRVRLRDLPAEERELLEAVIRANRAADSVRAQNPDYEPRRRRRVPKVPKADGDTAG